MSKGLMIGGGIVAVLLVGALVFGGMISSRYNDMVQRKEAITGAWSQVDTVIQRRADLIPNLVETVKGFAAQEKEVFSNIAEARAALGGARTPAERIAARVSVLRSDQACDESSVLGLPGQ